mgnify:FL=1
MGNILRYLCTRFPRDRGYGSGVIGESVLEKKVLKKRVVRIWKFV